MRSLKARRERGAAIVQVAVAVLGLTAFSVLVIDYGVVWVARRQAQNAADAGAHGGAVSLAFEDSEGHPIAIARAADIARSNQILGQAPSVVPETDISFPTCPDGTNSCIKVDVYRSPDRGNALPAFFGPLIGVTSQRVRATATAQAMIANQVNCLKPWAVADKWEEVDTPPWQQGSEYTPGTDIYPPSWGSAPGSGFRVFNADGTCCGPDYGLHLVLKYGEMNKEWSAGWFMALALEGPGGNLYREAIKGCPNVPYQIGDTLEVSTEPGNMVGPTQQGVETDTAEKDGVASIVNQDPTASWDSTINGGRGGVVGSGYAVSPRIVPIPLFDPRELVAIKNGRTTVTIVNIMGFFVEGAEHGEVHGYLCSIPGNLVAGTNVNTQNAFIRTIRIVQ